VRFIPSWFPGAEFRRVGIRATSLQDRIRQEPFDYVIKSFENNGPNGSLASELIEAGDRTNGVRDVLAVLYSGESYLLALNKAMHLNLLVLHSRSRNCEQN